MKKLCPHCLALQDDFDVYAPQPMNMNTGSQFDSTVAVTLAKCNVCTKEIPLRYLKDYETYSPVECPVIGYQGHGKTVFIAGLILQLKRLAGQAVGSAWGQLVYQMLPIAEETEDFYEKIAVRLAGRQAPEGTKEQPGALILRLSRIPAIGGAQVILHDTPGESLDNRRNFFFQLRHLTQARFLILLVSFPDVNESLWQDSPQETQVLDPLEKVIREFIKGVETIVIDGVARNLKDISVLVVITKGDEIAQQPDFDRDYKELYDFLTEDATPEQNLFQLDHLQSSVRAWLVDQGAGSNCLLLEQEFKSVDYCMLSASGGRFVWNGTERLLEAPPNPRGVLLPLFWTLLKRMEIKVRTQIEEIDVNVQAIRQALEPFHSIRDFRHTAASTSLQAFEEVYKNWDQWICRYDLRADVFRYQPAREEENRLRLFGETLHRGEPLSRAIEQIRMTTDFLQKTEAQIQACSTRLEGLEGLIKQQPLWRSETEPWAIPDWENGTDFESVQIPSTYNETKLWDCFRTLRFNLALVRKKLEAPIQCENQEALDALLSEFNNNLDSVARDLQKIQSVKRPTNWRERFRNILPNSGT